MYSLNAVSKSFNASGIWSMRALSMAWAYPSSKTDTRAARLSLSCLSPFVFSFMACQHSERGERQRDGVPRTFVVSRNRREISQAALSGPKNEVASVAALTSLIPSMKPFAGRQDLGREECSPSKHLKQLVFAFLWLFGVAS